MDTIRRSIKISRRGRIQNEEVRRRMNTDETLHDDIERKQLIWYGHVLSTRDERLPKKIMECVPQQCHKHGRQRKLGKKE